jgi:hypothetical protein
MRVICVSSLGTAIFNAFALLVAVAVTASGQASGPAPAQPQASNTPPLIKHRPIPPEPPDEDQQQHLAYWTSETGWSSELQLRNNAASRELTVTPVLRLPSGAETSLAPVTIKPQEVRSVDLSYAIFAAAAPQLIGTYGSAVLRFRSPSSGSLYAAIMVRRAGHAVAFHIDATGEAIDVQKGSREGIWWLPKDSTTDYLIVSNQGGNTLSTDLRLYDSSGKEAAQQLLLGAGQTSRLSVRSLLQHAGLTGSYGGIKIAAASHAGSLNSLHFLFDEEAGFSAILKMFDYDPATKLEERDYAATGAWTLRAPMLALSILDSALGFPPDTILQPQIFLRNTTTKPIDASLRFNWRTATATGKAQGPALHLAPYETRRVDVAALQGAALPKLANWTSVTITTNSNPDELVAVAASYDGMLRYGAQTPFSDQLTFMWEGGMWEYDPYHNSIITAGNGGTKPTRAAFTIFYNQGTQRYDLEQDLQPDDQMWIDVGKLIREHVPGKNGNTLPADLTSGSYEFRDLTNKGVGTLFEGKVIYDKTYGHVAYGCASCCGYSSAYMQVFYDPLGVPFQSTAQQGVNARQQCTLTWDDVSDAFLSRWASANTAIATVDYYATHTGVSIGSTTSSSSGYLDGHIAPRCPQFLASPRGGANVNPTVTFGDTPLVPLGKPVPTTATVNPSANTTPITLSISVTSGTGAATFANGYTTMTITTTTSVTLVGVTASSAQNNMQLTATVGSATVGPPMVFTVTGPISGAIPVNYRQTLVRVDPSASLHFEYMWDSSSGNKADLSSCTIEEYVTYVGPNPYVWASPPYAAGYAQAWPYTGYPGAASAYNLVDDHGHVPFQGPYQFNSSSSDQKYQFQCPNYQNNQWVQIFPTSGTIPITRVVNLTNGALPWKYQITKYPYTTSMNLP